MNKHNTENFILKSKEIHNDKFDYSLVNYKNNKTKVKIICLTHGVFEQFPSNHLRGRGCVKCRYDNDRKNINTFINESNIIHNFKYDYTLVNYTNNNTKVSIICPEHGSFSQTPKDHLKSHGCPCCYFDSNRDNLESFIDKSNKIFKNKYDYSLIKEYKNNTIKLNISCRDCNKIFEQTANCHLSGRGCPNCSKSKGEKEIINFLEKNNINFITQYKFDDCKNIYSLPFDFYLPDYNMCIEYQGIQHYKPIDFFGGYENFLRVQKTDNIKEKYCLDNNITLEKISYKKLNTIEFTLSKIINEDSAS